MNLQYRYFIAAYGFLLTLMTNLHRVNICIAVLKMTKNSTYNKTEDDTQVSEYFDWSTEIQGHVLAAGNLGYLIPQLLTGRLAEKFGPKVFILVGLTCSSLANMFSPIAARFDPICLIVVQLLKGLAMGAIGPSVSCLIASWFPKQERRFVYTFVYSGLSFGSFLGGVVSGVLCELHVLNGWPLAFYVFGAAGFLLFLLLSIFMCEVPERHPSISEIELKLIVDGRMKSSASNELPVPWMKIFFSAPCLALFYGSFGQVWMASYFVGVHNLFLGNVLDFPITENGTLFAVGSLLEGVFICLAGYASDALMKKKHVSLNFVRKGNNALGTVFFVVFLLVVYFAGYDKLLNAICCIAAIGLLGFGAVGSCIASVEMTPNFAGTLTGLNNTLSGLASFLVPLVAGYLTTKEHLMSDWRKVFLINIAVGISSAAVFQIFGYADIQPWNGTVDDMETTKKKMESANREIRAQDTGLSSS